jgi:hypothetical protein
MLNLFEHDKFLFVAFEPGARGYRFCRELAHNYDNIYWYSCKENGVTPLDNSIENTTIKHRLISHNHFDRLVNGKMLPPLFTTIEPYYNDIEEYYPLFKKLFIERGGLDIMENGQYIMYPVHVTKSKIKEKFPNARIEEIIPDNIENVVDHYLNTSANFPAYLKMFDFRPDYLTTHAKILEKNKNATIRDLFDGTDKQYKKHVHTITKNLVQKRTQQVNDIFIEIPHLNLTEQEKKELYQIQSSLDYSEFAGHCTTTDPDGMFDGNYVARSPNLPTWVYDKFNDILGFSKRIVFLKNKGTMLHNDLNRKSSLTIPLVNTITPTIFYDTWASKLEWCVRGRECVWRREAGVCVCEVCGVCGWEPVARLFHNGNTFLQNNEIIHSVNWTDEWRYFFQISFRESFNESKKWMMIN